MTSKRQPVKARRDGNEREIIDFARAIGCFVRQMKPETGFDLVVNHRGVWYIAEVKQPGGELTGNEKVTKAQVEAAGGEYPIIHSIAEFCQLIGVEYQEA